MSGGRPAVARGIAELAEEARQRYGVPLVRVQVLGSGVMGSVGLASQEEAVRELVRGSWPGGRARLLVLARRRPRAGVYPEELPLKVWRSPLPTSRGERELTTELLPGDPGAALLAVFPDHLLVRAPGEAVGWVARSAAFRVGPAPDAIQSQTSWDPERVLGSALRQLGRPYVWGGTGAEGLDCSGLVWRSFLEAGVLLPRNSRAQRLMGRRVRVSDLQPADLVAALSRGPARRSHVALALGPDEVVHACSETMAVRREPLREFQDRYQVVAVRRLAGVHRDSR
ncbi:MAG: C40 family peptidase [Candidatus Dormibacteraeota bacterium]|nr:C40 family peptidase [Candidatus Dormibacteraeota bacterium]